MKQRVVLLLCLSIWGVTGKVDHKELRGEHPDQEDIDNGQCVPMPCVMGVPPPECKKQCDLRRYETICQPPADFCLCRHIVHGKKVLVSPDEVIDQPPDSSEVVDRPSENSKANEDLLQERPKVIDPPLESSKIEESPNHSESNQIDGVVSYQIFTVLLPIKQFLFESLNEVDPTPGPTVDTLVLGYEPVNVHEGRLFWDFRYILTGLLLLMIGLVAYELVLCAMQVYGSKSDLSGEPEVIIKPVYNEKILNV